MFYNVTKNICFIVFHSVNADLGIEFTVLEYALSIIHLILDYQSSCLPWNRSLLHTSVIFFLTLLSFNSFN